MHTLSFDALQSQSKSRCTQNIINVILDCVPPINRMSKRYACERKQSRDIASGNTLHSTDTDTHNTKTTVLMVHDIDVDVNMLNYSFEAFIVDQSLNPIVVYEYMYAL